MIRGALLAGVLLFIGGSISGCAKQAESDPQEDFSFGTAEARPEDRFGEGFGEAFRADPYSEPKEPSQNDMKPISLTAEPVPID